MYYVINSTLEFLYVSGDPSVMSDQRMWSVNECYDIFARCLGQLGSDLVQEGGGGMLVWDKVRCSLVVFILLNHLVFLLIVCLHCW